MSRATCGACARVPDDWLGFFDGQSFLHVLPLDGAEAEMDQLGSRGSADRIFFASRARMHSMAVVALALHAQVFGDVAAGVVVAASHRAARSG
jgi:hypothetical protein